MADTWGESLACSLPFYWRRQLVAQTVERTAYAQIAERTLGVGTVKGSSIYHC
jgi:hypothetical protein